MRINHNLMAMNTHRQIGVTSSRQTKNMERLSSGLRINRAGDDAAGLAISEKMRGQIRGLNQASRNAQDGISLIQTAEGNLSETHDILQRMRELAVQSSNGTLSSEDRTALQAEVEQLKSEVDRIGNTCEFNTKKLLNGALEGTGGDSSVNLSSAAVFKGTKGVLEGVVADQDLSGANAIDYTQKDALIIDGKKIDIDWSKYITQADKSFFEKDFSGGWTATGSHNVREILERCINSAIDDSGTGAGHISITDATDGAFHIESSKKGIDSKVELYMGDAGGNAKLADGTTDVAASKSILDRFVGNSVETAGVLTVTKGDWQITSAINNTDTFSFTYAGQEMKTAVLAGAGSGTSLATVASDIETKMNAQVLAQNTAAGKSAGDEGFLEDIQVSVTSDGRLAFTAPSGELTLTEDANMTILDDQGLSKTSIESAGQGAISFQIGANKGQEIGLSIADMRASALGIGGVDVSSAETAETAITTIGKAITAVSAQRGKLGAVQNRLEHTIKNLDTSAENLQASESRIRDVDMAKEMMELTKQNILQQAAQAMLAQANQAPQGVLQLLR